MGGTSVARHHEEGPFGAALATHAPSMAALGADRAARAVAAAQEVIVPPEAGRTAAVPRLPRLSRRR
ncbi:hypothetical protein [Microbacterium paulum]